MKAERQIRDFIPVPEQGVEFAELDGEGVLYFPEHFTMFRLNETARVIWVMCDGYRTVSQITAQLVEAFPDASSRLAADISDAIEMFAKEGLLKLDTA